MAVGDKLQIKPNSSVAVLSLPVDVDVDVDLELPAGSIVTSDVKGSAAADAVIVFTTEQSTVGTVAEPAIAAALDGRLAWIAYPKGGKLGTDLNRDILTRLVELRGAQPARQIAIDETWSAMRFRPAR